MSLEMLAEHVRPVAKRDSALPLIELDEDAHVGGLVAWFGADRQRRGARIVIRGEDVGVLEREYLYELVGNRTLGWGDSAGATLPGDPDWQPFELLCPVPDCPRSPVWVLSFDPSSPPECSEHPGSVLERPKSST